MTRVRTRKQTVPIPFVGPSHDLRQDAQETVNLIPAASHRSPEQIYFFGRPGLTSFATTSGTGRGAHVWGTTLYVVVGTTLYSVNSAGTATSIGIIAGSDRVTMADDGDNLVVTTGSTGYVYDGTTLSTITDAEFPATANFADFIDDYILVIEEGTGRFWYALSDPTSWADFATAEGSPDDTVSLLVDHREVWLFGQVSIEIWFNDGVTPFIRQSGGFIERGCLAKYSPAKLDNTVFWLGDDGIVYRADGFVPIRISSHAIEAALRDYGADAANAIGYTATLEGHPLYFLNVPGRACWVYDVSINEWHQWRTWGSNDFEVIDVVRAYNKILGLASSGAVYEFDFSVYTDHGTVLERIRSTANIRRQGNLFSMYRLEIDIETGHTELTDPLMWMQFSRDRGKTWSDKKYANIGNEGEYGKRIYWTSLGSFRDVMFRFGQTDAVKANWISASAQIEDRPV